MKGIDRRQRYLKDFLRVGRIGTKYKVFGAPGKLEGPYDDPKQAEEVYQSIINGIDKYEVVGRKIVRKDDNQEE